MITGELSISLTVSRYPMLNLHLQIDCSFRYS